MSKKRLFLTAGFSRSLHVLALAELLHRQGHTLAGILVVNPYSFKRLKRLVRQRGRRALKQAALRMMGWSSVPSYCDPLRDFLVVKEIPVRSLRSWATEKKVPLHVVSNLNVPLAVKTVMAAKVDGVIYGGGGILRHHFIEAANRRVLNAHSGLLPQTRGMNACEWSLLLGFPLQVTIHYIDEGIDTGSTIEVIPVTVEPDDDIERLRSKCTVAGIEGLLRNISRLDEQAPPNEPGLPIHRQCFVMAPALREILAIRLKHMTLKNPRTEA